MRKYVFLILALQLAACNGDSDNNKAQAKALLDSGIAAYQKEDYAAAWPLFAQAAQAGHMKTPRYLGLIYLHGNGVTANPIQAFAQFQQAADKGDITSQYWLGYLYENGIGTAQNLPQALHWYEISAQRGNHISAPAMTVLGRLYEEGKGIDADRATAIAWYEKATGTGGHEVQAAWARLKQADQ